MNATGPVTPAMRAGAARPVLLPVRADTHQGEWTPGRPFLAYQHAWHPKTRECYRASSTGAPTGEIPGTGRHWERCLNPDLCPSPFLSLGTDPQGHAYRACAAENRAAMGR